MRSSILVIGFLLFSIPALAAGAIQIDLTKSTIAEQQQLILKAINGDAKYSEMTQTDRSTVEAALIRISDVLSSGKSITVLDDESRRKVDMDQSEINKLLVKAYSDSRLVCTKESPIGTNLIKRVCKTAAARNRENDASRINGMKVNQ